MSGLYKLYALALRFLVFLSANPSNFNLIEGLVDYVGIILSIISTYNYNNYENNRQAGFGNTCGSLSISLVF